MTANPLLWCLLLGGTAVLHAQAGTTASRAGDLQAGIGFTQASSGYALESFRGFAAYADFDFSLHLGVEAEFHQANTPASDRMYERTYEIGARTFRTYGPLSPFIKGMVGRGVFNYKDDSANLAYDLFAGGAGVDVKLGPSVRIRGEYEIQRWSSFPNGGLTPQLVTVGVAYHFNGKPRFGR